jgi:hypothetical protein
LIGDFQSNRKIGDKYLTIAILDVLFGMGIAEGVDHKLYKQLEDAFKTALNLKYYDNIRK